MHPHLAQGSEPGGTVFSASIYIIIIAVTYSLTADAIQHAAYLLIFASALPVASADRSHPPDRTQPCRRKVHVGIGHRPAPNQNR